MTPSKTSARKRTLGPSSDAVGDFLPTLRCPVHGEPVITPGSLIVIAEDCCPLFTALVRRGVAQG